MLYVTSFNVINVSYKHIVRVLMHTVVTTSNKHVYFLIHVYATYQVSLITTTVYICILQKGINYNSYVWHSPT